MNEADINYLSNKVFYGCGHLDLTYDFKWRLVLNLKIDENSRANSHSIWLMFEDVKVRRNEKVLRGAATSIRRSVTRDLQ
jgi:hypothetical protein